MADRKNKARELGPGVGSAINNTDSAYFVDNGDGTFSQVESARVFIKVAGNWIAWDGTVAGAGGGAVVVNDPGLPDALGQSNMAGSTSVVIASNQSSLPVTLAAETTKVIGTINLSAAQTLAAVTAITNALPAGTNLLGQIAASQEVGTIYSGTSALTPSFATFGTSSSGATSLVSSTSSKKITVHALWLTANGTTNVKFQSHTTPTDLTGLAYLAANTGIVLGYNPNGWFQTIAGEQLDINNSAAVAIGGSLLYTKV